MNTTLGQAFIQNFLGNAPAWYKRTIIAFLIINPMIILLVPGHTGGFIAGWLLIAEFIFTLAMALKCYPLQPGGLLAIEAVIFKLTSSESVYHEALNNFQVILLLIFMVAGIYFMKDLLLYIFARILIKIRSKMLISFLFCFAAAFLSAFLDALTVTAVLITVAVGFYSVYHKVASGKQHHHKHDHSDDNNVKELHRSDLDQFRAFLRSLLMHGAVGTALGGVCTLVGEPQNLLIAHKTGWDFFTFFKQVAPVSMPTLFAGFATCFFLEYKGWMDYGKKIPDNVRSILEAFQAEEDRKRDSSDKVKLLVQGVIGVILIISLATHIAEVGIVGLMVIVLLTTFNGIINEHEIGHAFQESLPFTALLVVFFAVVAVIHDQHLFTPIINHVLEMDAEIQPVMFFIANGLLSMISDNVFVATVYINEVQSAFDLGQISHEHYETLAVAINTGTNLPSVATPNGQAAFLFLLTSAIAPLIRLSYGRMVLLALPYTIVMSGVGILSVAFFL
ncbi:MAG: sodium/proton antiporter NhaB [Pseudomonadales bacterium]|nr:sodium/proton antiporter NhaB [Pseudomonadales bacterium]